MDRSEIFLTLKIREKRGVAFLIWNFEAVHWSMWKSRSQKQRLHYRLEKNVNDDDGVCFFTKVALISAQIKIDCY